MSSTIKCTNPMCEAELTLTTDGSPVICPECNTWHFPETSSTTEASNHTSSAPVDEDYSIPEYDPPSNVEPEVHAPVFSPTHEEYIPQEETVRKEQPKEEISPGFILLDDQSKFELKEGENKIGRKSGDIIIDNPTISREHCVIEAKQTPFGWEFLIFDVSFAGLSPSTNGVFIDGRTQRLQDYERVPISYDTEIELGSVKVHLVQQ